MIDLHTHILHGVDDGPRAIEGSLALARALVAAGVHTAAATPHVREDFPTSTSLISQRVRELRSALVSNGVPLDIRPGAEVALDRVRGLTAGELRGYGLGGDTRYLLLEMPYFGWPLELSARVRDLRELGVRPVLAHPERNPDVQEAPAPRLAPLVKEGAIVQVTAASVDGRLGAAARKAAAELFDDGLVHLVASDAHAPDSQRLAIAPAVASLADEGLARWLSEEAPGAVLAGDELPRQPPPRSRRRVWRR